MRTKNNISKILLVVLLMAALTIWSTQVFAQTNQGTQRSGQTSGTDRDKDQTSGRNQQGTFDQNQSKNQMGMNMNMNRYLITINHPNADCETTMKSIVNTQSSTMGRSDTYSSTNDRDRDDMYGNTSGGVSGSTPGGTSGGASGGVSGGVTNDHGSQGTYGGTDNTYGDTTRTGVYDNTNRNKTYGMERRSMFMREWGCSSDDKVGYIITTASSETEALNIVPQSMRSDAKVVKLTDISGNWQGQYKQDQYKQDQYDQNKKTTKGTGTSKSTKKGTTKY